MSEGKDKPDEPAQSKESKEPTPIEGMPAFVVEAQVEEALPEVPKGHRLVVYTGFADVVEHGEYTFRVGKPVAVPSKVAEELLTLPFESFEAL